MTGLITAVFGAVSGLSVSRAITQPEYTQVEICHGDTLWDIARTFYTTVEQIKEMNGLETEEVQTSQPLILVKKVEN